MRAGAYETYLFDFKQMVYGEELQTYFFHFIRPEKKFQDTEALKEQLHKDKLTAQQ